MLSLFPAVSLSSVSASPRRRRALASGATVAVLLILFLGGGAGAGGGSGSGGGFGPAVVSAQSVGVPCMTDANCTDLTTRCYGVNGTVPGVCLRKPLFAPFTAHDALTSVVVLLSSILAAGGGLGGGGILVPLFALLLDSPQLAIPLSKATIFGSAIGSLVVLFRERHPKADRPMIDTTVAIMFEPPTLAGSVIGVLLNRIIPSYLITLFLVVLLSYMVYRTTKKGVETWRSERKAAADASLSTPLLKKDNEVMLRLMQPATAASATATAAAAAADDGDSGPTTRLLVNEESPPAPPPALARILEQDRTFRRWHFAALVGVWVVVFVLSLLKGGTETPSIAGIHCGTAAFWVVWALVFPFIAAVMLALGRWTLRQYRERVEAGFVFLNGDVKWTLRTTFLYPSACLIAGIAAGLLGIGGGMIKTPLMLEMGILPPVAAATSSLMILFTSSSTTAQFLIFGAMPFDYAGWFAALSFIAAIIGQYGLGYLLRKYRRVSLLVFLISLILAASVVLLAYTGISRVVANGFEPARPLCQVLSTPVA